MKLKTYNAIIADNATKDVEKEKTVVNEVKKREAMLKLKGKVDNAELARMKAEEAFNNVVINGGEIDKAALELKSAEETEKFYNELYNGLFPDQSKSEAKHS